VEKGIMQDIDITFLDKIKSELETGEQDIRSYSPLVFAYIGDCIYELVIRCKLVLEANEQVQKLHKKATSLVKAEAQARIVLSIMDELTEEEVAVYKRARNAKPHTTPKNGKLGDYHKATGFEAVMGYLYLTNQEDRILYLIKTGLANIEDNL